jgi:hypothetical protein
MNAEERYIKALRAESAAVRALMVAMKPPIVEYLLEERQAVYDKAVRERKEALKALEQEG